MNNLLNSAKQRPERGQQVSTNPSVPAWLPSDIARRIDSAELADIPESASRELEVEADALGVYLAPYRQERCTSKGRTQLCACIRHADVDQEAVRALDRLQARFGVVLVAYARPLRLRM